MMLKIVNKKKRCVYAICILSTIFIAAEVLLMELVYYPIYTDSDSAGYFLAAGVALKEHTVIPQGYNHSSALGFESHVWLMPLFLALFKNIKGAVIVSNLLMLLCILLSSYMLLRSFKINRVFSYLCSLLSVLPLNLVVVELHIMSQYYLIQLIGAYITIGLFNYIGEERIKKKILICGIGGAISFLETLNGSRYIALIILPLVIVEGCLFYEFVSERLVSKNTSKDCIVRMFFLLCVGIGSGIGYIAYFIMTHFFSTYNDILGFTAIYDIEPESYVFFDRIKEIIRLWFKIWGFELNGQNMASLTGIETIICLLLPIQTVILSIKICINVKDKKTKYFACYAFGSLLIASFLMAIMDSISPTTRYFYFVLYHMLFLIPIYFSKINFKTVFLNFFNTLLSITVICFVILTQFNAIGNIKETWEMEKSGIMTTADYREDINEWLNQNGYEYGYATYWNANISTVLSDCRVKYAALTIGDDMNLYPFFGGMVREYYNSALYKGKAFIVLTHEEDSQVKQNLPSGWVETYHNDLFVVYGYAENPYDFSADLLQYFPVKGETIILESENFATQGNKTEGNIILENNDKGGYLIYGSDLIFPIDASYDIEYNFTISKKDVEPAGYIAVLANGAEEIARAEINGEDKVSMMLEEVPILADGSTVDFVIYLNPGCDAIFKDIAITRVR